MGAGASSSPSTAGFPRGNASVTESQNHRIAGVGRDLCGSPSPTLPAESRRPAVELLARRRAMAMAATRTAGSLLPRPTPSRSGWLLEQPCLHPGWGKQGAGVCWPG